MHPHYFENSLQDDEIDDFVEFISERFTTREHYFTKNFVPNGNGQYNLSLGKTFDGITDPIAIIDHEYNVIRNNQSFFKLWKVRQRPLF